MKSLSNYTLIGLGTWNMEKDPRSSVEAIRAGVEEGANHIDTAEMYGSGRVEDIVGEAVQGIRDKVFIVSKVLASNAGYKTTLQACERSLKHLKTDFLDVYLLHWRERQTPLEETFRAFEKLKAEGKIKAWGVSNFDMDDMAEAVDLVGEGKIVCNQVYYSIGQRSVEAKLLPWCNQHNVTLVAYSPLGQGRMPEHPVLRAVAKELHVTPAQTALAFLIRNEDVIAIPKSSDPEHTRENVRAMKIKLNESQVRRLNEAFPVKSRRTLPMI